MHWMKEQETQPYKGVMQWQVTSVLMTCAVAFVLLYVPDEVLAPLTGELSAGGEIAARLGIAAPAVWMLRWVLFAQDHLATGNSYASRFFRHYYVSLYTRSKYELSKGEADTRWFEYFNQWEGADNPNHGFYRTSVKRTYSCRLIYYLKRILCVFAIGAVVSTLSSYLLETSQHQSLLPARIGVALMALLVVGWLSYSNRIRASFQDEAQACYEDHYDEQWEATGVFAKYKEIAGILRSKFEADQLRELKPRAAPRMPEAF